MRFRSPCRAQCVVHSVAADKLLNVSKRNLQSAAVEVPQKQS